MFWRFGIVFATVMFVLAGCSASGLLPEPAPAGTVNAKLSGSGFAPRSATSGALQQSGTFTARPTIIEPGQPPAASTEESADDPELSRLSVELNFVDTDVREFARILFSELLKRPYTLDANVMGQVTVRSGGQIDGNKALSLARQALGTTGNAIRLSGGVYRVTNAGGGGDNGASRTFALSHIDPAAAQNALGGLLQGRAEIVAVGASSLTIRGDAETLQMVGSMIAAIDIDRFATASFGLFPLSSGSASEVTEELRSLYSGAGVVPPTMLGIERINAVLIIATRPEHLDFAKKWIARLDQRSAIDRQVYIYAVRNRDAADLAKLLTSIFATGTSDADATPVATSISEGQSMTAPGSFLSGAPASDGGLSVTADTGANKLIIRARPKEYQLALEALNRLDTPLSQVYVEATIVEVRLSGELSHGVRWFLQSGGLGAGYSDNSSGAVAESYPGFNFSFEVPEARVVISALESHTKVRIVSSPQLTVVDRQTASIQVGDQVPVITKSVQNSSSGDTVIANDVTFRDTGVILKVTPQIRGSGQVELNIEQEVSRVVATTSSAIDSPTISQRKVASTVLVPDGRAIVLGGLMTSSEEETDAGLPGTHGTLLESIFGSGKESAARTELIVIIRPMVIADNSDLRAVANEIADKMRYVINAPLN
jgi:general secretion pathway protein D